MAASSASVATTTPASTQAFLQRFKPYLAPYYLTLAAILGALTTGFLIVVALLVLVVSNFNVLGWVE